MHSHKAKAINKLQRTGLETRLRLASKLESKGVTVTDSGIPSAEELADAMADLIRGTQQGDSTPSSSEEAQEILSELKQIDLPEADEDQETVEEILADLEEMEIPLAD